MNRSWDPRNDERLREMRADGLTLSQMTICFGCARKTVIAHLRLLGLTRPKRGVASGQARQRVDDLTVGAARIPRDDPLLAALRANHALEEAR